MQYVLEIGRKTNGEGPVLGKLLMKSNKITISPLVTLNIFIIDRLCQIYQFYMLAPVAVFQL